MAIRTQGNQEPEEGQEPEGGHPGQRLLTAEELDRLLDEDWEEIEEGIRMDNALTEFLTAETIPGERLAEILHLLAKSEDLRPLLPAREEESDR